MAKTNTDKSPEKKVAGKETASSKKAALAKKATPKTVKKDSESSVSKAMGPEKATTKTPDTVIESGAKAAPKKTAAKAAPKKTAAKAAPKKSAAKAAPKKSAAKAAPKKSSVKSASKKTSPAPAGVAPSDNVKETNMASKKESKKDSTKKSTKDSSSPSTPAELASAVAKKTLAVVAKVTGAFTGAVKSVEDKISFPESEMGASVKPGSARGLVYDESDRTVAASDNLVVQARSRQYEMEAKGETKEPVYDAPPVGELPDRYNETILVLLPRDPEWAYAYWDVSDTDRERHGLNGDAVLRMHDVTDLEYTGHNSHTYFDTHVGGSMNWYLRLPADRDWVAELGRVGDGGAFKVIARSNPVRMARNTVSPFGPDESEESWMTVESDFEKIFELSGGKVSRRSGSSEEAPLFGRKGYILPRIEMGSEALASGALYGGAGFESPGRGFRLVVNTELIVYGATEPSATVTIQGHPVRLNPDGTFRIRLALPDGVQEILVKAVRDDGEETRAITPVISRETR